MFNPKFLISLSGILGSVFGVFFWIIPLWNDPSYGILALRAEREVLYSTQLEREAELKKVQETREEFLNLWKKICDAGVASNCNPGEDPPLNVSEPDFFILPAKEDIPEYLAELTSLANDNGLVMTSVSFKPVANSPSGLDAGQDIIESRMMVDLNLVGTYSSLKFFLDGIENSQRLSDVTKLSFDPIEGGTFNFAVALLVYFQP